MEIHSVSKVISIFLFISTVRSMWAKKRAIYAYDPTPTYSRIIPAATEKRFIEMKMYKWSFWGTRNEKLRDLIIQLRILQKISKPHDKKLAIIFRYPIPEDLAWFKNEIIKIGVDVYIDSGKGS